MELTIRVQHEGGSYWAEVVELPGCFASGATLDELRDALEESISLYLVDHPDPNKLRDVAPEQPCHVQVDEIKVLV